MADGNKITFWKYVWLTSIGPTLGTILLIVLLPFLLVILFVLSPFMWYAEKRNQYHKMFDHFNDIG